MKYVVLVPTLLGSFQLEMTRVWKLRYPYKDARYGNMARRKLRIEPGGRENLGVAILKQATNVMIQIVWKKLKLIAVSYKIWRRFSFKTTPLNDFCIGKSINPLSLTNSS